MASTNVGLVCGMPSTNVFVVIVPGTDAELDNPAWLTFGLASGVTDTSLVMVLMPRSQYSTSNAAAVQSFATAALGGGS